MEALDGSNRPSGILSTISREQNDQTTAANPYPSTTMAATAVASPSFAYPSEPAPRYEVTSTFAGRSSSLHGLISPPESRRTSDPKNEPTQPPQQRQSLPSIHEALGPKPSYSSPPSAPLPTSHELPFSKSQAAPTPTIPRSYPPADQGQYASQLPPPQPRQRTPPQPMHPQPNPFSRSEPLPSSYHEPPRHPSVTSLQTAPAPPHNPYTPPRYEPARFDADSRAPERAINGYPHQPTPAQPAYTYGPGPAPFPAPTHQPPVFSQPRYQTRDFREVHEPWKGDKGDPAQPARQGIKRNLDVYDFENNLAAIHISSSALAEWSAHYNAIAQEQQRSINVLPDRMPTLDSVKEMKRHQEKILGCLESMTRIINEAQQQSERAMMEQRSQDQGGRPGEYDDEVSMYGDEMKNHGYASEGKKRRGRAAPPGRCHSCNRAETPEWRRGPDGARTLCNACGLHYAKLTRKNTLNKTSQSSNGSSLRPKSLEEVSPRPQ